MCVIATCSHALSQQYIPMPILTGFNQDIVADGTTNNPISRVDTLPWRGVDNVGYVFLAEDFNYDSYTPGYFLPTSRMLSSTTIYGLQYMLADYDKKNSLILKGTSGILIFNEPVTADSVFVLATSGSGASNMFMSFLFTDSSSYDCEEQYVEDWFRGEADITVGERFELANNSFHLSFGAPKLYTCGYNVKSRKKIYGIKARSEGEGLCNILAISIKKR